MKSVFFILLLTIGLAAGVSAQTESKAPVSAKTDNSLLWQISGKGLKSSSYLFGTYHFAGKVFVDSLAYIDQKFKSCKAVVGEVIMDSTAYEKMMPMMMLKDNSLDKLFTPAEYKQIVDSMKKYTSADLDVEAFNSIKPAAVEMMLVAAVAPKTMGEEENPPLDIYFQYAGKKLNLPVTALETVEFQSSLILNGNLDDQKRHLLKFLHKMSKEKRQAALMYQLYRHQDLQGLGKLLVDDEDYNEKEMDTMLKNRNLKWMEQLPGLMTTQSTFIAVGAGHLVGQYGLINQLRLKGYTVTPVKQ